MIGAMLSLLQEDGWILRDCGDVVSEALLLHGMGT